MLFFLNLGLFVCVPPQTPVPPQATQAVRGFDGPFDYWVALEPSWAMDWYEESGGEGGWKPSLGLEERNQFLMDGNQWTLDQLEAWQEAQVDQNVAWAWKLFRNGELQAGGNGQATAGIFTSGGMSASQNVLVDFDVEIAQASSISSPEIAQVGVGVDLGVKFSSVPGKGWQAEFALVMSKVDTSNEIEFAYSQIGNKPRIRIGLLEIGGTVLLSGKPQVIHFQDTEPGNSWELHLQCQSPTPNLVSPAGDFWCVNAPDLPAKIWDQFLQQYKGDLAWGNEHGSLVFSDENLARLAAQALANQFQVSAAALQLGRTQQGTQTERLVFRGNLMVGYPIRFASGLSFDALVGWGVEVASAARIADPEFATYFSGWKGQAVMVNTSSSRGNGTSGEVDFSVMKAEVGESRVVKLAGELGLSKAEDAPPLVLGLEQVRLEFPLKRRLSFVGRLITGGPPLEMTGSNGQGESTQYSLRLIP